MTARSSSCKACGVRTTASAGYCQSCKSRRHHGHKRLKEEDLLLDEAGGAWWVWDRRGDVIVSGKPTRDAAVIALATGDVEDDDCGCEHSDHHAKKKTGVQLDKEIAHALTKRAPDDDAGTFYLTENSPTSPPLGPEFRSYLAAKRAAMKLVREGRYRGVEVWHHWRGGRYMQGLAREEGWSDV